MILLLVVSRYIQHIVRQAEEKVYRRIVEVKLSFLDFPSSKALTSFNALLQRKCKKLSCKNSPYENRTHVPSYCIYRHTVPQHLVSSLSQYNKKIYTIPAPDISDTGRKLQKTSFDHRRPSNGFLLMLIYSSADLYQPHNAICADRRIKHDFAI